MLSSVSFVKMLIRFWNLIVLAVKFIIHYWTVPAIGVAISALLWLYDVDLAKIIFWGIFTAFTVAGKHVLESLESNDLVKAERFCDIAKKAAKILFLISLAGIAVEYTQLLNGQFWQILTCPLLIASTILFILSIYGKFSAFIVFFEGDWYDLNE